MAFSMTIDARRGKAKLDSTSKVGKKAMKSTLNKLAKRVKVEGSREIKSDYNIKASDVKKAMKIKKATPARLVAEVIARGKRIPLILFKARQSKGSVSVQVRRSSGRTRLRKGFIATVASGHRGIFERRGRTRLPIEELTGPSIPQLLGSRRIMAKIKWMVLKELPIIYRREFNFLRSRGA